MPGEDNFRGKVGAQGHEDGNGQLGRWGDGNGQLERTA